MGGGWGAIVAQRILVVDDDVSLRLLLDYRLAKEGYDVVLAANGLDALEQVEAHIPDLIILDLDLPRLDGLGFLRRLRSEESTSSIPVLVLTAYGFEQNRSKSLDLGASAFMVKPFSSRALIDDLRHILQDQGSGAVV